MKAMILAAGLGTRLRPLTDHIPKPLLPVAGRPMIEYTIGWLTAAGIRDVVINLHHHPATIREALGDGTQFGVTITYSEEPTILGTGGALKRVEAHWGTDPFLVVNADVLTSLDPNAFIRAHHPHEALATLAVRRDADASSYGTLGLGADGRIRHILGRGVRTGEPLEEVMFTGIHMIDPRVLAGLPPGEFCSITDEYIRLVERDVPLRGYLTEAAWIDIGTAERYRIADTLVTNGVIPRWGERPRN